MGAPTPVFTGMPKGPGGVEGLTPNGNFKVGYEQNTTSGLSIATQFYPSVEGIWSQMTTWFPSGSAPPGVPLTLIISSIGHGGGAAATYNQSTIVIGPQSDMTKLSMYLVAELSELFMYQQGVNDQANSWFGDYHPTPAQAGFGDEGSMGEGLSMYLAREYAFSAGKDWTYWDFPSLGNTWLGSNRADYISQVDPVVDTDSVPYLVKTACALLFLNYLHYQLGFTTQEIIAARSGNLMGVYNNLTHDSVNPYFYFKSLLDRQYPPPNTIPNTVDQDNPFPIAFLTFTFGQNSFSRDAVKNQLNPANPATSGLFQDAFQVTVEGLSEYTLINQHLPPSMTVSPSTPFTDLLPFNAGQKGIEYTNTNIRVPQMVNYWFGIQFSGVDAFPNPATNDPPKVIELDAQFTLNQDPFKLTVSSSFNTQGNIVLLGGADPFFSNLINTPGLPDNPWYLSNDLRVFTATPSHGSGNPPVAGGPTWTWPDNSSGAYSYLASLLQWMNIQFNDPNGPNDPFATGQLAILPSQGSEFTNDSSVTPYTYDANNTRFNNYNFAIARVRMSGQPGDTATGTKVFFRLWTTSNADSWFDPTTTYITTSTTPDYPKAAPDNHSFPVFGTPPQNLLASNNTEFGSDSTGAEIGLNVHDIEIPVGKSSVWVYYGCFLDLYAQPAIYPSLSSGHHCLVAQIDYSLAPIQNANGIWASPQNNDKLAQRNLSYTPGK
jgi:hypothetical protein